MLSSSLANNRIGLATIEVAIEQANVVVVLVDHQEFKIADRGQLAKKVVIDTRGIIY